MNDTEPADAPSADANAAVTLLGLRLVALERRLAVHAWVSLATTILLAVAIVAGAR